MATITQTITTWFVHRDECKLEIQRAPIFSKNVDVDSEFKGK